MPRKPPPRRLMMIAERILRMSEYHTIDNYMITEAARALMEFESQERQIRYAETRKMIDRECLVEAE